MNTQSKHFTIFLVNNLLLLSGLIMVVSGLLLQIGFHIGHGNPHHSQNTGPLPGNVEQLREPNPNIFLWGMSYDTWAATHKIAIVLFSLLMVYHFAAHWKWYKGIFAKHLVNKNLQVVILTFLFVLVALTGLIPWFIDLLGNNGHTRLSFIELHDKLALVLTVFLVLHVVKRVRWYSNSFEKVRK